MKPAVLTVLVALTTAACGSETASPSPGAVASTKVSLAASTQALRVPATETLPSFRNMLLQVYDAAGIWNDPNGGAAPAATPLYAGVVTSAGDDCVLEGCAAPISSIAIGGAGPNLVGRIWGNDPTTRALWAPVYTNIVNATNLQQSQRTRTALNATAPAYALSTRALQEIARLLSLSTDALVARGLLIGIVASQDAKNYAGGLPSPVAGARITLTASQAAQMTLYYPNTAYTNPQAGTSTNDDGVFWLVGNDDTAPLGTTTLAISSNGSGLSWAGRQVALMRNSVIVAPISALP